MQKPNDYGCSAELCTFRAWRSLMNPSTDATITTQSCRSVAPQHQGMGLMDIPPELRVRIYEYVFTPDHPRSNTGAGDYLKRAIRTHRGPVQIDILLASKLIYKEALPILRAGVEVVFFNNYQGVSGPFDFLSNFYPCKFRCEEFYDDDFNSAEQCLQVVKALYMQQFAEEPRFSDLFDPLLSSEDLIHELLDDNVGATECLRLGRAFDGFEESDTEWWASWYNSWKLAFETDLKHILYCKFRQNETLARLLMATGDLAIVNSSRPNCNSGIMFHVDVPGPNEGQCGSNLLGETLMEVRSTIREEFGIVLPPYNSSFWKFARLWEAVFNSEERRDKRGLIWLPYEQCLRVVKGILQKRHRTSSSNRIEVTQ